MTLRPHGIEKIGRASNCPTACWTFAYNRDAQGFNENKTAAHMGGTIAKNAREDLEQASGKPVISQENFLGQLISSPDVPEFLEFTKEL
ncbi:MAG: hypothetical protein NTX49_08420 [Chlamydiae bacterium]|nr:hypothetical protein [Chlamydiota bacterium]